MDFYVLGNSNNCVIKGLRDETGAFVDNAALVLNIYEKDDAGSDVLVTNVGGSPAGFPYSFVAEGQGEYRATLPATLDLTPGTQYLAEISGTAGTRVFKERRRLHAKKRLTK